MPHECYVCNVSLAAGPLSREHIIPNALGGRLVSDLLLCESCNSELGRTVDAALCKQLNPVANALGIARARGSVPRTEVVRASGERLLRDANGTLKPPHSAPVEQKAGDGKIILSLTAPSMADARRQLRGLARKYPTLNVDELLATASDTIEPVVEEMTFELPPLGGALGFRAITKIAVNYFLSVGGSSGDAIGATNVIKDETCPPPARVGWFYHCDPLGRRDTSYVTHVLAVADDGCGRLCAYVELFRAFRFSVLLSDDYRGPRLRSVYAFDVCDGKTISVDAESLAGMPWLPEDEADPRTLSHELGIVVGVAESRSLDRMIHDAVRRAVAASESGPGSASELAARLMHEIEPVLRALLARQQAKLVPPGQD